MIGSETASVAPYLIGVAVLVGIIVVAFVYAFWPRPHRDDETESGRV